MSDSEELEATHGRDCYVCGKEVLTNLGRRRHAGRMGVRLRRRRCADGLPGLGPIYACPDYKDDDA